MRMIDVFRLGDLHPGLGYIEMPQNADVLFAQNDSDRGIWVHAIIDSAPVLGDVPRAFENRRYAICGYGTPLPPDLGVSDYVGSVISRDGSVLHVFVSKVGPVMTEKQRGQ